MEFVQVESALTRKQTPGLIDTRETVIAITERVGNQSTSISSPYASERTLQGGPLCGGRNNAIYNGTTTESRAIKYRGDSLEFSQ